MEQKEQTNEKPKQEELKTQEQTQQAPITKKQEDEERRKEKERQQVEVQRLLVLLLAGNINFQSLHYLEDQKLKDKLEDAYFLVTQDGLKMTAKNRDWSEDSKKSFQVISKRTEQAFHEFDKEI